MIQNYNSEPDKNCYLKCFTILAYAIDDNIVTTDRIENEGKDCWKGCKKTQGECEWCGTDGWCCRLGWEGNGCDGSMGASGMGHVCTSKGNLMGIKCPIYLYIINSCRAY